MSREEIRRRSRWMMRVLEWDDPRARYPNVWHEGMPRLVLAFDTVASRLRLGDLIAVCYPSSRRHPERAERFLGLARVTGVRRAHEPSLAWIDLETAHRFDSPLDLGATPRRVFLCCDPGWSSGDVTLFQRVFDAAVEAGWQPTREEHAEGAREATPPEREPARPVAADGNGAAAAVETARRPVRLPSEPHGRLFGGADYSGDMRDPKQATWLAVVESADDGTLRVVRLEPTGRTGLQSRLRDADTALSQVEAFGLDFPFGLPLPFAEVLLGGPFPGEGWWALARRLEKMSRPEYLIALQEFRDVNGELKRHTDTVAGAFSPLHRVQPDLGPTTFHGIRMLAEERSRYAVKPFESARGRLFLEVYPGATVRSLEPEREPGEASCAAIVAALERTNRYPVRIEEPFRRQCAECRDALDSVLAARSAAVAVLSGETDEDVEALAPGHGEQVRKEGWIYGLRQ